MSVFLVAFRLHEGSDYDARWASVVAAVRKEANNKAWEEATSAFIFQSFRTAAEICHSIYMGSKIYDNLDLLLVVNLSAKDYAQRGAKYPHSLDALMKAR